MTISAITKAAKHLVPGRLPDWIIVGAMKAGTSTLHFALHQSPQAIAPARKELQFFSVNWARGATWYRQQFYRVPFRSTGEASPYYLFHPHAAERMAGIVPDAKLIVLLRDPIERAYSHWGHEVRAGRERLQFAEAVSAEPSRMADADPDDPDSPFRHYSYVSRGMYSDQLERLYKWFDPGQVLVLEAEAMFAHTSAVVERVSAWLGLRSVGHEFAPKNVGHRRAPMDGEVRAALATRFAAANRRLFELVGRDFGWETS